MNRKQKLAVFVIMQAVVLSSMYFPTLLCENPNCRDDDAFDCGSIGHLSYPFWGGRRPPECGRQGFQIVCHDDVPMINISSLSYRVLDIDLSFNTLKLARQDLWNNRCPKLLLNTTIDHRLFEYPRKSTDQNVSLYYHCTLPTPSHLPNEFHCFAATNLFYTGDESSGPGPHITCTDSIFVPINKQAAQSLQNPTPSSIIILQAALASGFSILWFNDSRQFIAPFCNRNVYGSCLADASQFFVDPAPEHDRVLSSFTFDHTLTSRSSDFFEPSPVPGKGGEQQPVKTTPRSEVKTTPSPPPVQNAPPPPFQTAPPPQSVETAPPRIQTAPPPIQTAPPPPPVQTAPSSNYHRQIGTGSNASRSNPANKILIAVVPLCITSVVIASIITCFFIKRRHSANSVHQECNQFVEKYVLQHGSLTPRRYKYCEIKKITKSFTDKLGQGGYGHVYKGSLPDGSPVAVKVLIQTADSNGEEFINEVASISRTSHVNIVSLLGFCHEGKKRALVYEFMPNKSLDTFLSNCTADSCLLDLQKLYKIAVGIAKGLEYLHSGCSTRIVHFDIKPQNILLDEDLCPKISDFGLAKLCKKKQSVLSVVGTRGTIGYIAPEVFSRNFGAVSHKSDVYSYGMMILDMVGEKRNVNQTHHDQAAQSSENYFPDKIYEQLILEVTRKSDDFMIQEEQEEEETRKKMFLIGFWCIQTIPSNRPSMSKVVEMLEGSLQSIPIPPKPFLFTPSLPEQEISSTFSAYVETDHSADQDLILILSDTNNANIPN